MLEQLQSQILLLPETVQLWMRWLNIVFLLGIFFVKGHKVAVWALVAYLAAFLVGLPIYYFTRSLELLGLPHFICWLPLLVYILTKELTAANFKFSSLYGIWIILLSSTIIISLFFDAKGIYFAVSQ